MADQNDKKPQKRKPLTKTQKRDAREVASLVISAASLAVGIAALSLNEKPEEGEKIPTKTIKDIKRDEKAFTARKRQEMDDLEVHLRNEALGKGYRVSKIKIVSANGKSAEYDLVPVANKKPIAKPKTKKTEKPKATTKTAAKPKSTHKYVAMEMNRNNGRDMQAIVCNSESEAKRTAKGFKDAHRKGSQRSKDCVQGYIRTDTSNINIPRSFRSAKMTRV